MAQLIVLLGGRAAELAVFDEPSTRAEDDLEQAASLARRMVHRWAMTGRFDLAGIPDEPHGTTADDAATAAVRRMLARAEQAARTILGDHARALRRLARHLVDRETVDLAEAATIVGLPLPDDAQVRDEQATLVRRPG